MAKLVVDTEGTTIHKNHVGENDIVIFHAIRNKAIYKLHGLQGENQDEFAFLCLTDSRSGACGSSKTIPMILDRVLLTFCKEQNGEIIVFDNLKEFAEWLIILDYK